MKAVKVRSFYISLGNMAEPQLETKKMIIFFMEKLKKKMLKKLFISCKKIGRKNVISFREKKGRKKYEVHKKSKRDYKGVLLG